MPPIRDDSFFFVDESKISISNTDVYSMTGLCIPISKYADLRKSLYQGLVEILGIHRNNVILPMPELHYCSFLNDYDDNVKLKSIKFIVEELVTNKIEIYRIGYFDKNYPYGDNNKNDKSRYYYSACWFSLQQVSTETRRSGLQIPVFDAGFNPSFQRMVDGYSGSQKLCDSISSTLSPESISIHHSENLAEISYVDSKHSILIQIADCISGLMNERMRKKFNAPLSAYKNEIYEISKELEKSNLISSEEHITFNQINS